MDPLSSNPVKAMPVDQYETFTLEKMNFYTAAYIPFGLLEQVDASVAIDAQAKNLMLKVKAWALGENLPEIKKPHTWWDAFKERFFPKWLQRRFPIKYQVWDVKVLYPFLRLPREHYTMSFNKRSAFVYNPEFVSKEDI